jgi:hypothetical protein
MRTNRNLVGSSALLALLRIALVVSAIDLSGTRAYAQAASGTLGGVVYDQTGAAVPDVRILVRNIANGFERRTVTDRAGAFALTFLVPGEYLVVAARAGFATSEVRNVLLSVNDQLSVVIHLSVQGASESVTVIAEPSRASLTTSVGTVVDRQFLATMPLNGRSLHALLQLVPGVILTSGSSSSSTGAAQFSVNGQRTTGNYFMVDGVSANTGLDTGPQSFPGASGAGISPGVTALGSTNSLASLDAVQEFRIETSTFAAEFGRTPGAQVSLVTRAGTNALHGIASEYFRHESMDANDWFANRALQPEARHRQYLFSGVLGGPLRQDRAFFFASYEGMRLQQPRTLLVAVPTAELRTQAAAALRPYLNALPLPNGSSTAVPGYGQRTASYSNPASFDVSALRLDGELSNRLTAFVRVNHAPSETSVRGLALSTVSSISVQDDAVTGGATWVASPRVTADMRINWTRNEPLTHYELDSYGGAIVPSVSEIFARDGNSPAGALFSFGALGAGFTWGRGANDVQRQMNVIGTLAWQQGRHQFKFGTDYRRMSPLLGPLPTETLAFFDRQTLTAGISSFYTVGYAASARREANFSSLSVYAQDAWHLSRRLTLTYGLRFERVPPPTEVKGQAPRTLLGIDGDIIQRPRLAPAGTPLWQVNPGWAPRVGVAYQLRTSRNWETTVRGGFGTFYDLGTGSAAGQFATAYPFFATTTAPNVSLPLSNAVPAPITLGVDAPRNMTLIDPKLRLPYTNQWNVACEQSLGAAQSITASYVGASGRRLLLVQAYPGQTLEDWPSSRVNLTVQRNLGESSYDALQLQYQRRLQRGLQALASYALARARDNASSDASTGAPASLAGGLTQEFGPSDFDVRHQVSVGLVYEIPAIHVERARVVQLIFRDWGADLLIRAQSAFPVNPIVSSVLINGAVLNQRPDLVQGEPLYISDASVPGGRRINPAAVVAPAGLQGTLPRNHLRGFGASQVDLTVRREIGLAGRFRVQLKAELFNVFNHPNFESPNSSISSPLFGQSERMLNQSLGGLNALYQMGGPRSGEIVVKLLF